MLEMRPATAADVASLGKTLPKTAMTFAIVDGEKVVAVAGYYLHQGKAVMFSAIDRPEVLKVSKWAPRDVLRFARAIFEASVRIGIPVVAQADQAVPGSDLLLEHLGMQHIEKDIYLWHGYPSHSQ